MYCEVVQCILTGTVFPSRHDGYNLPLIEGATHTRFHEVTIAHIGAKSILSTILNLLQIGEICTRKDFVPPSAKVHEVLQSQNLIST